VLHIYIYIYIYMYDISRLRVNNEPPAKVSLTVTLTRIPVGGKIIRTSPDRSWGPPSLLYNGYRVFPGGKAAGAWR